MSCAVAVTGGAAGSAAVVAPGAVPERDAGSRGAVREAARPLAAAKTTVDAVWRHQRATSLSCVPRLRYSQVAPDATAPVR